MIIGSDTLYGNEWIKYQNTYLRFKISADGIYRIPYQQLAAAGFPIGSMPASSLRLYRNGRQTPIYVTTNDLMSPSDFVEFRGERNKGEIDRFLSDLPDQYLLNDQYSLVNDTSVYYLTWNDGTGPQRIESRQNDLSNLPTKSDWCWSIALRVYNTSYFKREISHDITYSWYDGDGWGANLSSGTLSLSVPDIYMLGPSAQLNFRGAVNRDAHTVKVKANDSLIVNELYTEFGIHNYQAIMPNSRLNGYLGLYFEAQGGVFVPYVSLRYSRAFSFGGASYTEFELDPNPMGHYLEIGNFNAGGAPPVLYDLNTNERWETFVDAGLVKVYLPPGDKLRKLVLFNPDGAATTITSLFSKKFRDFSSETADYVIVSTKALFNDSQNGGADHVKEYADFRASAAGGNYHTTIVEAEELYEQFSYGIRFHPISIRNFTHYIHRNWQAPRHLFLIGKGLNAQDFRSASQQNSQFNTLFFIPNFGSIGSDMLFGMYGTTLSRPVISVGRLAVTEPQQIKTYLNKVIEHETALFSTVQTIDQKLWHKRILQISGGMPGEQSLIAAYIQEMTQKISTSSLGASVLNLYKSSNDPIQVPNYDQIQDATRNGVSIWTVFGHSTPNAIDYDIGYETDYQNKGRYPLMFILGCQAGACTSPQKGIGERFILVPNKGAVAYLATVNFGFTDALFSYGQTFYEQVGNAGYGKTIGDFMVNAVDSLKDAKYTSLIALAHQEQLQGDPALRLQNAPEPDYIFDTQSVRIIPNPVSIDQAVFKINVDLVNLGRNTGGGPLELKASLKDQTDTIRVLKVDTTEAPSFRRTVQINLPSAAEKPGFAQLYLNIDPAMKIPESPLEAENNNELLSTNGEKGIRIYFYTGDIQPVMPQNFSIVTQSPVTLCASSLQAHASPLNYFFEMDSVSSFDSPFKKQKKFSQTSGLLCWTPVADYKDSSVYYWRVTRDTLVNGQLVWNTRSFKFISNGSRGWIQSEFAQFQQDTFQNMTLDPASKRLNFSDELLQYYLTAGYRQTTPLVPISRNSYLEGPWTGFYWSEAGIENGIAIVEYDPRSGRVIRNKPNNPDNPVPGTYAIFHHYDTKDSLQRIALMQYLENGITPGAYVGLITVNRYTDLAGYAPRKWALDSVSYGKNLFQVLESLGAQDVRKLQNSPDPPYPYAFTFRKNDPLFPPIDTFVTFKDTLITIRRYLPTTWVEGQIKTGKIGPATQWHSAYVRFEQADHPTDENRLLVLGIRPDGTDTVLFKLTGSGGLPLSDVDVKKYPYLKLHYEALDSVLRTPVQLKDWWVLYDAPPEGVVNSNYDGWSWYADTLQQGDSLRVAVVFYNISSAPMDSLKINFRIESENGSIYDVFKRYAGILPGDSLRAPIKISTRQLHGRQRLTVEVNPDGDQPELYHFNNIAFRSFYVAKDARNPLLDLTFDGQHILNGDLISPKPRIMVTLKDENKYFALEDTTSLNLILETPTGLKKTISRNSPEIRFFPADPSQLPKKNLAKLEWEPYFSEDGTYKLFVNGRDASGNTSGTIDYAVTFKVINKSSISNILNYPNPFSTSTCFVYTMTGAEAPAHFKIQIMTVSGKIVREISGAEFGPMTAGSHLSDFRWDGRDEFGDQLANGVYLYRVVAKKSDGSDFEHFAQDAVDGMFNFGYGKMVLIR